jgi:Zinc finger C-x8-C-x5-C-x3-H type (and similar)/Zinc finger domain/CCCH-type zinc finger/RNA-binding, Nab2-type zinc finger
MLIRMEDAVSHGHANNVTHCRYWIEGRCNRGDACHFMHSEAGISPTFDNRRESPVSTPTLTSHTPSTDSDEVREIVALDVQTAEPEIHTSSDPEGIKQQVNSFAYVDISPSPKPIPLHLEFDSTISLHTGSDEECRTENPQAVAGTYFYEPPVSSSLEISHEDSQREASLEEDTGKALSVTNISSEECGKGEQTASDDGSFIHTADTCPDSEPCGLMAEDQLTPPLSILNLTNPDEAGGREQPASWSAQDGANPYGTDQESLTTERVDNNASIHQSLSYFEAEQVIPESMQNRTNAPQSDPPYEQDSYVEGEGQANHPFPTLPEAPEDVPHWSQYADPLADPSTPFCKFFAQFRCNQADACNFRHSLTVNEYALLFRDAQPPLWSSRAQLPHSQHAISSTGSAFGTCKFYPLGTCRNGDECPYLHVPPSNFAPADSEPQEGWDDYRESAIPSSRSWEVRPCRFYMESGYCRKGDECQFGHEVDTRSMQDGQNDRPTEWQNSNNKEFAARRTQPCKYFVEGNCNKGDRCIFLHETEEERGDGWGETTSNGWGETVDGWGAPNAEGWDAPNTDDWGAPATNSLAKEDGDERTFMADRAIGIPLSGESPADGPSQAKPRMTENKRPTSDTTTWPGPRTTPDSRPCRFYIRGQCNWGSRCKYRHDLANNDAPPEDSWLQTSWDVSPEAEKDHHGGVENDVPAEDSWGEKMETPWDVPLQTDEHNPADIETPSGNSWGDVTETPWNDLVQADHPSQATFADDNVAGGTHSQADGLGQTDQAQNDMTTSNIHKWALTVGDEAEVVAAPSGDDDEKTWSTPWSDVPESNIPVRIHQPCKAFGQGYCSKGDACWYQHIAPPDPVSEAQRQASAEVSA